MTFVRWLRFLLTFCEIFREVKREKWMKLLKFAISQEMFLFYLFSGNVPDIDNSTIIRGIFKFWVYQVYLKKILKIFVIYFIVTVNKFCMYCSEYFSWFNCVFFVFLIQVNL